MRLNRFVALASGLSRRQADDAIAAKRVMVNGKIAVLGERVNEADSVQLDNQTIFAQPLRYILVNKPAGYICSRKSQGGVPTVYELLPAELHHLNYVGRLDADSSGLLLMTNDGALAFELMHPSQQKIKRYLVELDKPLSSQDKKAIESGVMLEDGLSKLALAGRGKKREVTMREGRKRQIRRTFSTLGYTVTALTRTHFGPYSLGQLKDKKFIELADKLV